MANLWDTLDDDQKRSLVNQHVAGSAKTPENMNRAAQQLSQNPNLVDRLAKEAGITEGDDTLSDEGDVQAENEIEQAVDASLEDEGDMQQPGSLSKTLPPPEEGEDAQAYYKRIARPASGRVNNGKQFS